MLKSDIETKHYCKQMEFTCEGLNNYPRILWNIGQQDVYI